MIKKPSKKVVSSTSKPKLKVPRKPIRFERSDKVVICGTGVDVCNLRGSKGRIIKVNTDVSDEPLYLVELEGFGRKVEVIHSNLALWVKPEPKPNPNKVQNGT